LKMLDSIQVNICGSTLSNMLYHMTTTCDSEGLLFGTVSSHKIQVISDTQSEGEKEKIILGIQGFRFTGNVCSFYDTQAGIVSRNFEKILEPSKNNEQNLLGWFRFRKNTSLRPSLRELSVHSNLEKIIKSQQPLLFGLFTMNSSSNGGTFTYDYRFLSFHSSITQAIELNITNLIHSSQTEYNDFTPLSPLTYCTRDLTQLIGKMPLYNQDLEKIFEFTLQQLKSTVENVYQSATEIKRLEEEIRKLNETN